MSVTFASFNSGEAAMTATDGATPGSQGGPALAASASGHYKRVGGAAFLGSAQLCWARGGCFRDESSRVHAVGPQPIVPLPKGSNGPPPLGP